MILYSLLRRRPGVLGESRKGTNGVSTHGATANFRVLFDRGTFFGLPLIYFYLPKSARAYLFPQSVRTHYFCSGPVCVDPICPQPRVSCDRRLGMSRARAHAP